MSAPEAPKKRKVPYPDPADIAVVLFFLRGAAEEGLMFRAHRGREAFDACARMLGVDPEVAWRATE